MVFALKESGTSSLMAVPRVKSKAPEEVYVVDVEGASPDEPLVKGLGLAAANMSSPILPLPHYVHDIYAALASLGAPLNFERLRVFEFPLHEEYGGFRRDQMQRIQDFR